MERSSLRGGWVLAFIADRYYSNGLIISLVELGSKEYSLSILMDSVKEFESEITKVLNERAEDYVVNTENQPERLESIEERTTDLIKFLVEKFLIFRKIRNQSTKSMTGWLRAS